ncbi:hypothetical protein AHAS_Ahas09G0121900 [Arachis hypogaea]
MGLGRSLSTEDYRLSSRVMLVMAVVVARSGCDSCDGLENVAVVAEVVAKKLPLTISAILRKHRSTKSGIQQMIKSPRLEGDIVLATKCCGGCPNSLSIPHGTCCSHGFALCKE